MDMILRSILSLCVLSACLSAADPAVSASAPSKVFVNAERLAVEGYDLVGFFTASAMVPGRAEFQVEHQGAIYRFASVKNRDLFVANPAAYLPQYGGYCAVGAAYGGLFPTQANTWAIVNGKLYLNKNPKVAATFAKDIPGFIAKADAQWPTIPSP